MIVPENNIKVRINNEILPHQKRHFDDMKLDKILEHYKNLKGLEDKEYQCSSVEFEMDVDTYSHYKNLPSMKDSVSQRYSIETQMECETYTDYYFAGKIAKSLGLDRIVDIGCAHGFQSYVITQQNLNYLGIEVSEIPLFKIDEKTSYLIGHYPFEIKTTDKDLGVAMLSLFWNCYLFNEETLTQQIEAVSEDFKYLLARVPKDKIDIVAKSFKCYDHFGDLILFRK